MDFHSPVPFTYACRLSLIMTVWCDWYFWLVDCCCHLWPVAEPEDKPKRIDWNYLRANRERMEMERFAGERLNGQCWTVTHQPKPMILFFNFIYFNFFFSKSLMDLLGQWILYVFGCLGFSFIILSFRNSDHMIWKIICIQESEKSRNFTWQKNTDAAYK